VWCGFELLCGEFEAKVKTGVVASREEGKNKKRNEGEKNQTNETNSTV
jgi:hypothetical protein